MVIVETPVFTRRIAGLMPDDDYAALQHALAARPDAGALIPGGGGLRKLRWAASGRGKRGGARVVYYWAVRDDVLLMLFAYAKNERADLTREQAALLRTLVREEFP